MKSFLGQAFGSIWVGGEMQRLIESRAGHLYFELAEHGEGDAVRATMPAVLFRSDHWRVRRALERAGLDLREGQTIRCLGSLDFYPPQGRMQLVVRDVDAVFSLGELERRRRETLAALERSGLLTRNRELTLTSAPLRIALLASAGSAAFEDFVATLEASRYRFEIVAADVAVQGVAAVPSLVAAMRRIEGAHRAARLDAVVLIRGGGSRSDLSAFDDRELAEALARSPVPVLTGLGHEIDRSIADHVAHRAFKTPTGVGEFLVQRVREVEEGSLALAAELVRVAGRRILLARHAMERAAGVLRRAREPLHDAALRLVRVESALERAARARLADSRDLLSALAGRLATPPRERLREADRRLHELASRLPAPALRRLREARREVATRERLCRQLAPARILERGFSVTRSSAGDTVRSPSQVRDGETLTTETAGGTFRSTVVEDAEARGT